jgi:hypothetical protein
MGATFNACPGDAIHIDAAHMVSIAPQTMIRIEGDDIVLDSRPRQENPDKQPMGGPWYVTSE